MFSINTDQIILMVTAGISLTGVILSFLSVRKMGKQIDIQKKQWEYSQKPIFRIIKTTKLNQADKWVIIVENSNNVFYKVDSVTYSSSDILLGNFSQGTLKIKSKDDSEEYHGLTFTLQSQVNTYVQGVIQIRGKDLLGNTFICNSPPLTFKHGDIVEEYDYYKVFFDFV